MGISCLVSQAKDRALNHFFSITFYSCSNFKRKACQNVNLHPSDTSLLTK